MNRIFPVTAFYCSLSALAYEWGGLCFCMLTRKHTYPGSVNCAFSWQHQLVSSTGNSTTPPQWDYHLVLLIRNTELPFLCFYDIHRAVMPTLHLPITAKSLYTSVIISSGSSASAVISHDHRHYQVGDSYCCCSGRSPSIRKSPCRVLTSSIFWQGNSHLTHAQRQLDGPQVYDQFAYFGCSTSVKKKKCNCCGWIYVVVE